MCMSKPCMLMRSALLSIQQLPRSHGNATPAGILSYFWTHTDPAGARQCFYTSNSVIDWSNCRYAVSLSTRSPGVGTGHANVR